MMDWEQEQWRASDGYMREVGHKEGHRSEPKLEHKKDENIKGYEPTDREKREFDEPKRIGGLESSYGNFSVGINRKKEMIMVTSQKRTKEIAQPRSESKNLMAQTGVRLQNGSRAVKVNGTRKRESAMEYRESSRKQASHMMKRLTGLKAHRDLEAQDRITPFLTSSEERVEIKALNRQGKSLYRTSGKEEEKDDMQRRLSHLEGVVRDKEQQKLRFYKRLMTMRDEAREQKIQNPWDFVFGMSSAADKEISEDGREDEGDGKDEGKEKDNGELGVPEDNEEEETLGVYGDGFGGDYGD